MGRALQLQLLACAVVAAAPGCKGKVGGAQAEAGTPYVPRNATLDEGLQFRVTTAGPACEVLARDEAAAIWFGSVAAMECLTGTLVVFVERYGAISLDDALALIEPLATGEIVHRQPMAWQGRDAMEVRYATTTELLRERFFVRDGWLYRFTISRGATREPATDEEYDTMWAAIELLHGTLAPVMPAVDPDPRGVGWRVANGRWESVAAQMAIRPPAGWRLITGDAMRSFRTDIDVLLSNDVAGTLVTLTSATTPIVPQPHDVTMVADIAGGPRTMVRTSRPDAITENWMVTLPVDRTHVSLSASGPSREAETTAAELRRALTAFELLSAAELDALAADHAVAGWDTARLGEDWAVRSGHYASYGSKLVWRHPGTGMWRVIAGADASDYDFGAELALHELRRHFQIAIVAEPSFAEPGAAARWLAEYLEAAVVPVDAGAANPRLGPGAEGTLIEAGVVFVHRAFPLAEDGHVFRVHAWGSEAAMRAHADDLARGLDGLRIRRDRETRVFTEWRFGFQLALDETWQRTDHDVTAGFMDRSWATPAGDELVGVMVEAGIGTNRLMIHRGRRRASSMVADGTAPQARLVEDKLDGRRALRLVWDEPGVLVTVFLVEKDGLVYTLYLRGSARSVETVRRAFRFLDRPD